LARFYCANFRISLAQRRIVFASDLLRLVECEQSPLGMLLRGAHARELGLQRRNIGVVMPGVRILRWWRLLLLLCGESCPERELQRKNCSELDAIHWVVLPAVISEYFYD